MEKIINVEALQKRFKVELKETSKAKRNRSYSNASPCHPVVKEGLCGKLEIDKVCSVCKVKVDMEKVTHKVVKIGKQEYLIPAAVLDQTVDQLEGQEELVLHTFVNELPADVEDRLDSVMYMIPAPKKDRDYKELKAILEGRFAIGKGVFRSNEFEVIVKVGSDGLLRIMKLVDQSQLYDVPDFVLSNVELSGEVVKLERMIIDRKTALMYDFTKFQDSRAKMEESIIEEVVLTGKMPEFAPTAIMEEKESDEEARLKALLDSA